VRCPAAGIRRLNASQAAMFRERMRRAGRSRQPLGLAARPADRGGISLVCRDISGFGSRANDGLQSTQSRKLDSNAGLRQCR